MALVASCPRRFIRTTQIVGTFSTVAGMFLPCVVGFVYFLVPRHGRRKVAVSGPGNGVFVHELKGYLPEGCGSVEPNHEEEEEEVAASRLGVVLLYQPGADPSFRPLACCLQLQKQQHWNCTHAYYNELRSVWKGFYLKMNWSRRKH